jgi:hypothetical protein
VDWKTEADTENRRLEGIMMVENDVIAFGWDVTQTPDGTGKQTVYSVLRAVLRVCALLGGGGQSLKIE